MTPADLAKTHALCFATPRAWTAAEFTDLLATPTITLWGDERAFLLTRTVLDETEILTLATHPDQQRHGHARALLEQLHAQRRGRVFLEVAADNLPAQRLYQSLGYTAAGQRKNYYRCPDGTRLDARIMAKTLPD